MADELQVERNRLVAQSTQINKRIAELDARLSGQNKLNDLMGLAKANVGLMQQIVQATTMLKQRIDDLDDKRVTFESILGQLRSFLIDNVAKRIDRLEERASIEDDLGSDGKTGQGSNWNRSNLIGSTRWYFFDKHRTYIHVPYNSYACHSLAVQARKPSFRPMISGNSLSQVTKLPKHPG